MISFFFFSFFGLVEKSSDENQNDIELPQNVETLSRADTNDSRENVEEKNDIMISSMETQSEDSAEVVENISEEEIEMENVPPEKESSARIESKWAWPLVHLPKPVVKKKKNVLKIGFITDPHVTSTQYGNGIVRVEDIFRERLEYFMKRMNADFAPHFLIINGDVIEGTKRPSRIGTEELSQIKSIFDQTVIKKYWIVGNHDLRSVTKKQWKESLNIPYTNTSFEVDKYKIILVDSNFQSDGKDVAPGKSLTQGTISSDQEKWLKKELEKSKKKKIIFLHHPLLARDRNTIRGAERIRAMLSQNNVIAVFSGHSEVLFHKKLDGVEYFTLPGMTKNSQYLANFVEIVVDDAEVSTKIYFKNSGSNVYTSKNISGNSSKK